MKHSFSYLNDSPVAVWSYLPTESPFSRLHIFGFIPAKVLHGVLGGSINI